MKEGKKQVWWPILIFAAIGALYRLVPHLPNFAALGAISLTAGFYAPRPWRFILPLAAAIISDKIIGFYAWPVMLSVWASYLIMAWVGSRVARVAGQKRVGTKIGSMIGGSLLGSTLFYLITNAAVVFGSSWYPHTLAGLERSYILAVPFFRSSLVSDAGFTAAFVVIIELVSQVTTFLAKEEKPVRL